MGYCATPPALVYEFMENGSLHSYLHGKVLTNYALMKHAFDYEVVKGCRYIDLDSAWPHFEGFMPWSSMVAWEQATFDSPGCQIVCTVFTMLITITTASCDTVPICTPRANILLDKCFNAKLGDFGFSVELPRVVGDRTLLKARTFVRTEGYYPPELSEGLYSPKSDVYSYGVVSTFMNMNQDSYPMHTCVFLQVVLETYTGQKAYSTHREDRRLVNPLHL